MFAYSQLVNDAIEAKAIKHGFSKCIEGPLSFEKIHREILDFIEKDKKKTFTEDDLESKANSKGSKEKNTKELVKREKKSQFF